MANKRKIADLDVLAAYASMIFEVEFKKCTAIIIPSDNLNRTVNTPCYKRTVMDSRYCWHHTVRRCLIGDCSTPVKEFTLYCDKHKGTIQFKTLKPLKKI